MRSRNADIQRMGSARHSEPFACDIAHRQEILRGLPLLVPGVEAPGDTSLRSRSMLPSVKVTTSPVHAERWSTHSELRTEAESFQSRALGLPR